MRARAAGAAVTAAVGALLVASCGGGSASAARPSRAAALPAGAGTSLSISGVRITPRLSLAPGAGRGMLPGGGLVASFDVHLAPGSRLVVGLEPERAAFELSRPGAALPSLSIGGAPPVPLPARPGWLEPGGWRHVEIAGPVLAIDGRTFALGTAAEALRVAVTRGRAQLSAVITSPASEPAALLFDRLAELHARVPADRFPTGATVGDRLYYDPGWTSGFYAGALWQAAALEPAGGMFARWATQATIDHFGMERAPTHDVGFMYGQSSLNAWRALCGRGGTGGRASPALCARLRTSVVSAASELLALAATNPGSGTIPTDPTSPEGETIVDSMMNIAILPWATSFTGSASYSRLARHQANVIAALLVRRNGSTAQSANFDRATGKLLSVTTHQGLSNRSTWSRGQGWALYGFAVAAIELHDRGFLRVASRVAAYVAAHLPAGGVPRWDYDAPAGAPVDVSAGVITAAGLLHLAAACRQLGGLECDAASEARWVALARRMLTAALGGYASARPPLGLLRSQIEDEHFHGCWCNSGELIYGLSYALEAMKLQR